MLTREITDRTLKLCIFVFVLLITMQCATKTAPASALPDDVLGIKLDMSKADAEQHLREIGKFSRAEPRRNQQVWTIKNNPYFGYLAIGYDREDKVSFVTGIADPRAKQKMRFAEVGNLETAKKEVIGPNNRYIWEVPAKNGNSQYSVMVYGQDKEFLSTFTITKPQNEEEEE